MDLNYFKCKNKFYKQTFGTTMGNNLSPFLAELFMNFFENYIIDQCLKPRIYHRYVDDIICIIKRNLVQIVLDEFNSKFPSIKFTIEEEKDNKINFLDLTIIRENKKLNYDIFRKPTHTNRYIPADSFHPFKYKAAAFNSMFDRLFKIPLSKERFQKEKSHILEIASVNGFELEEIKKLFVKKEMKIKQHTLSTFFNQSQNLQVKRISVPYFPKITFKLQKKFKQFGILLVTRPIFKLSHLINIKDKILNEEKSGIYKINCNCCDKFYIGKTSRNFNIRFKEHERHTRLNYPEKSTVAKHSIEEHYKLTLDKKCLEIIKPVNQNFKLDAWESFYIQNSLLKNQNKLLNEQSGTIISELFELF